MSCPLLFVPCSVFFVLHFVLLSVEFVVLFVVLCLLSCFVCLHIARCLLRGASCSGYDSTSCCFDYMLVGFETVSGCRWLGMVGVEAALAKDATQPASARFAKA